MGTVFRKSHSNQFLTVIQAVATNSVAWSMLQLNSGISPQFKLKEDKI